MRGTKFAILAALAAALLAGCHDHVPENAVESCQAKVSILPVKTDILMVIDDSTSMAEEQENLRQNLAAFVTTLADSAIPHDFQIGVTTTDVMEYLGRDNYRVEPPYDAYSWLVPYPQGRLVAVNPAALTDATKIGDFIYNPTDGFGGNRILAAGSSTLISDFQANVLLGTHGASKEQHFGALERALADPLASGANAGFLRAGARLAVIIVTDEDDCSEPALPYVANTNNLCHDAATKARLTPPADVLSFLDGPIAGEQRNPLVAVIAGFNQETLEPTGCATSAEEPTRLAALLDALGPDRSVRASICDESFGPALLRIADMVVPQTVPLDGAPSSAHMLVASVIKADGTVVSCPVVAEGEDAAQAGAVYVAPQAGQPATLTFQNVCRLEPGDRVNLDIICAG